VTEEGRQAGGGAFGACEIAPGVSVFTSGAYAMNSGVVLGRAGPGALLVDPGYFPGELDRIGAFLTARGASVSWIALTHSDWDHIAGPPRWPGAPVVASSEFPLRAEAEGSSIEAALLAFDRKMYVARAAPFEIPRPSALVGSPSDLVWDGPRVHLFPAGGHTRDGMMLRLTESRILFTGDHLSDREIPFVGDSVAAYHETLAAVAALVKRGEIDTLVPGHGEVCGRDAILERIGEDADYLERLAVWVMETSRTVKTVAGLLDRADEVVFRKGADNPDVVAEHRNNLARCARALGLG
jgi:hydroxyacylglutathione hydrolase